MHRLHPWLLLSALALPACLNLPKENPGPRVVDDFESPDLIPTWSQFDRWICDTFRGETSPISPVDGGAAGDTNDCSAELVNGKHALRADFHLADPVGDMKQYPGAEVVTRTSKGTVNLTVFKQIVFSAFLEATPALPSKNPLSVALGCSSFTGDPLASTAVTYTDLMTGDLPAISPEYPLADFTLVNSNSVQNQACLAQVDSIHFAILPSLPDGQVASGTLHIGKITLQP